MNINATLIGQMITFALFVWFTMRFVWPPLTKALQERQNKIADGLAAAERGRHELALAQQKATEKIREVKTQTNSMLDDAKRKASGIIEQAKQQAQQEAKHVVERGHAEIERQVLQAKQLLSEQVADIALIGAEKILGKSIDASAHQQALDDLIKQLQTES